MWNSLSFYCYNSFPRFLLSYVSKYIELKVFCIPRYDLNHLLNSYLKVNELFSMYFRINNLKGCKNIIALVKSKGLQEKGTLAAMTTYRYYIGRLNLYEDNLESAETHLDYAFQHCHKNSVNNKRRILKYLVPIKVYRGRLPTTLRKLFEDAKQKMQF